MGSTRFTGLQTYEAYLVRTTLRESMNLRLIIYANYIGGLSLRYFVHYPVLS